MTRQAEPRLKVAPESVQRLKAKLKLVFRWGRGSTLARTIEQLTPILRGWAGYFRLVEAKQDLEALDPWVRRQLRDLLWRQWKRPRTRALELRKRRLTRSEGRSMLTTGAVPGGTPGHGT